MELMISLFVQLINMASTLIRFLTCNLLTCCIIYLELYFIWEFKDNSRGINLTRLGIQFYGELFPFDSFPLI